MVSSGSFIIVTIEIIGIMSPVVVLSLVRYHLGVNFNLIFLKI